MGNRYRNDISNWLGSVPLDTNSIPYYPITCEATLAVISEFGTFNVGDTLAYINGTGDLFLVTMDDYIILDSLVNGIWGGVNSKVEIYTADGVLRSADCKSLKIRSGSRINGNWLIKGEAGFYNLYFAWRWYASTRSYHRILGIWHPWIETTCASFDDDAGVGNGFFGTDNHGDCGIGPFTTNRARCWRFGYSYAWSTTNSYFRFRRNGHNGFHNSTHVTNTLHVPVTW